MKLELRKEGDLQILSASDPISDNDIKVLKAGIKKLLIDGKNKIILEIGQSSGLSVESLREIASLHLLAAELAGKIVISGVDAATRAKIENFSNPPFIQCFSSRSEAISSFKSSAPKATTQLAPPAAPYKEEIRQREISELGPLRKQLAQAQDENRALHEQLQKLMILRQTPPHATAYEEKIKVLENQIEDLTRLTAQKAGAAIAPKS